MEMDSEEEEEREVEVSPIRMTRKQKQKKLQELLKEKRRIKTVLKHPKRICWPFNFGKEDCEHDICFRHICAMCHTDDHSLKKCSKRGVAFKKRNGGRVCTNWNAGYNCRKDCEYVHCCFRCDSTAHGSHICKVRLGSKSGSDDEDSESSTRKSREKRVGRKNKRNPLIICRNFNCLKKCKSPNCSRHICLGCHSRSHGLRNCQSSTAWSLTGRERFCIDWNCGLPCKNPINCGLRHECLRCGSTDHKSYFCSDTESEESE
ncbi:hypothetical protein BCR33DRAFT_762763 [Rhizoclosmatium globosum]|uniref:CCHC-type domain-containing protein n=1 Tax=Rhizoclosmatium globosum TaxID=329046 RepID=A0A1Y2CTU2_9FUNG|nr:hypothetical protein BCR33DRAFT_762763 [Rhizoclosmatium globosum]|eukprot:ORY50443.1 hypothetical protein BCR33DRAFT_762763 [Rhizoclosmatium globosum]